MKMDGLWLESKQILSEASVAIHQARDDHDDHSLLHVPWEA